MDIADIPAYIMHTVNYDIVEHETDYCYLLWSGLCETMFFPASPDQSQIVQSMRNVSIHSLIDGIYFQLDPH